MKYEEYIAQIRRLEASAAANPIRYQNKVLGLIVLGYAYYLGIVVLFLLIPASIVIAFIVDPEKMLEALLNMLKVWWIVVPVFAAIFGFLGGALKALFSRAPAPEGLTIGKKQAPELFEFINETSRTLDSTRPSEVLITADFNASIVSVPRIGIFGSKVYLSLGLPMMYALSPQQFKAVLAHEIGHISAKHGRFSKWAYQLHGAWEKLFESQEGKREYLTVLYKQFVEWFFPLFSSYSFVLMREHEKEADASAVKLVGAVPLGEALINISTKEQELDHTIWKELHDENLNSGTPSKNVLSRMLNSLLGVDRERANEHLTLAVSGGTTYNDSHPSLADRLKAIGYWTDGSTPKLPPENKETAAEVFLGPAVDEYIAHFESDWDENIASQWEARRSAIQESLKRLDELKERANAEDLSPEELLEQAALLENHGDPDGCRTLIESGLEKHPENVLLKFNYGCLLLSKNDEEGLTILDKIISGEPTFRVAASEAAFEYLNAKGRADEAAVFARHLEDHQENVQKANEERQSAYADANYLPHELPDETVALVPQKLRYYEEILSMYLVKKDVEYFPEVPFHVLFIIIRDRISKDLGSNEMLRIANERLANSGIDFVALEHESAPKVIGKLQQVPNALVYKKS